MDEAEAIRLSRNGDKDAFHWLVDRYSGVLKGTAYLMTQDAAFAEDLVQEAFALIWRGLPSFRLGTNFKAWAVRILVNHTMSHRRKRRVPETPMVEATVVSSNPGDDPEEAFLAKDEYRQVRDALGGLPEWQRKLLVLRYYADMTVPEVARALGCREGTVKSRVHRALSRLREALSRDDT